MKKLRLKPENLSVLSFMPHRASQVSGGGQNPTEVVSNCATTTDQEGTMSKYPYVGKCLVPDYP